MKTILLLMILIATSISLKAQWLPREIDEVRAYVYDYTQGDVSDSLLKDGKLHTGIINDGGTKLSKEQVERLMQSLRTKEERIPGAFCYMPHHGFVFFDKDGKPMGHIELCFQCGNVESSPAGLPEDEWDWKAIQKLLEELNIPILKKDEEYTNLYTAEKARREQASTPESATKPESRAEGSEDTQPEANGLSR